MYSFTSLGCSIIPRSNIYILGLKLNKQNCVAAMMHYGSCHHGFTWIQSWFLQWNQNRGPNHIWRVTSFFRIASFCLQEIIFFCLPTRALLIPCLHTERYGRCLECVWLWLKEELYCWEHTFHLECFCEYRRGRAPLNPLTSTSQAF